ncbi:hypothetical protein C0992_010513 [Termitomyces sp. T32_za158]|nr:hypothetical protein C0992_010513 [Termitomyces sp. T32_za158]
MRNSETGTSDSTQQSSRNNTMGTNTGSTEQAAPIGTGLDPQIVATGMEKEVERFWDGEQFKEDALIRIITLCGKSSSPTTVKQQTTTQYIKLIDKIEKQIKRQIERGQNQPEKPQPAGNGTERANGDHREEVEQCSPCPRSVTQETDRFLASIKHNAA